MPGLYAEATLTLDRKNSALVLPLQAVSQSNDQATIFLVDPNNTLQERKITLGIQTATDAEVLSGLNEGDRVVVSDRSGLKAGMHVKPQDDRSSSSIRAGPVQRAPRAANLPICEPGPDSYFMIPCHASPFEILTSSSSSAWRCLVIGVTSHRRMPVDLFPPINLPEVVVATFYSGMPPEDIETDITNPLERFFTLASGIDHMESRSLLGVSMIKVFFQPGTSADADVTELSNLALADLKRLPPGTLPPVVLKFDASSLPVCLVTVKGEGLTETQLHDLAQFQIRNQIAVVKGAEIPGVFGGKYRQAMIYVDPYKLFSRQLSVMDVVGAVNDSNLILPAGDVKIGPNDYYVYSNSLVKNVKDLNDLPLKTVGTQVGLGGGCRARPRTPASCSTTSCASTARNPPTSPS